MEAKTLSHSDTEACNNFLSRWLYTVIDKKIKMFNTVLILTCCIQIQAMKPSKYKFTTIILSVCLIQNRNSYSVSLLLNVTYITMLIQKQLLSSGNQSPTLSVYIAEFINLVVLLLAQRGQLDPVCHTSEGKYFRLWSKNRGRTDENRLEQISVSTKRNLTDEQAYALIWPTVTVRHKELQDPSTACSQLNY